MGEVEDAAARGLAGGGAKPRAAGVLKTVGGAWGSNADGGEFGEGDVLAELAGLEDVDL